MLSHVCSHFYGPFVLFSDELGVWGKKPVRVAADWPMWGAVVQMPAMIGHDNRIFEKVTAMYIL